MALFPIALLKERGFSTTRDQLPTVLLPFKDRIEWMAVSSDGKVGKIANKVLHMKINKKKQKQKQQ